MPMLAIRLASDIDSRLAQLAQLTGRTKTYYAREAILEYLGDLEDYYLAEERLKTDDPSKHLSLEVMMKQYDLHH